MKNVKKPLSPVVGEEFHCFFDHASSRTDFFAEQIANPELGSGSGNVPASVTAFHIENRKCNWLLHCTVAAHSRFHGNSATYELKGNAFLHVLNKQECYRFNFPSFVVNGLLYGRLNLQLIGRSLIVCEQTGLEAEIVFQHKATTLTINQQGASFNHPVLYRVGYVAVSMVCVDVFGV